MELVMIDREKVISGLECCTATGVESDCKNCPYTDDAGSCISLFPMLYDALALLKSDQAQLVEQRTRLETIADIALRGVPEEVTDDGG